MKNNKLIPGDRSGRLTYLGDAPTVQTGRRTTQQRIYVSCDCGTEKTVNRYGFVTQRLRSCGCLIKDLHRAFCLSWKNRR